MPLAQIIRHRKYQQQLLPTAPTTDARLDSRQQTWWSSLPLWERRLVASLALLAGVSLLSYVAFLFVQRQIRKARAEKEQTASFGTDKYATWAKQFKQAFDNDGWWGTDVPLVRSTMRAIPTKDDFTKVQESYKRMYKGANLIVDMSDELTRMEYQEMLAIRSAKPKNTEDKSIRRFSPSSLARRFYAALNYTWLGYLPGTDEAAVKSVFHDIPSQQAFKDTAYVYRKDFGTSLRTDLDGDLYWTLDWRALLNKKPAK